MDVVHSIKEQKIDLFSVFESHHTFVKTLSDLYMKPISSGIQLDRKSARSVFVPYRTVPYCTVLCRTVPYLFDLCLQFLVEVPQVPHGQLVIFAHHDPLHVDLI